jgi:eukaryotic-like serine/threonine-protein kinase
VVCALVLNENEAPPLAELAPRVPAGLAAVVARCLQKAREARFASVGELVLALAPFGSAEAQRAIERRQRGARIGAPASRLTVTPAPVAASVMPTGPIPPARRSWLWPVTAALAALLVGALSWGALRGRSDAPNDAPALAAAPATLVKAAPSVPTLPPAPAVASAPPLPTPPATTASANAARESAARPNKPPAARPAALRAGVSPPAPSASATPPRATVPSVKPPGDAWDLERLGGRY